MYIRPCYRRKNGKRHAYWVLVESFRTERGPRQRVVSYIGQVSEKKRRGIKKAAEGNQRTIERQGTLFRDTQEDADWVEIDTNGVRVENNRDFGGYWLGLELIRKL